MSFDVVKLFVDVFAPREGDVVSLLTDLPNKRNPDKPEWAARREMAARWHSDIAGASEKYGMKVNPLISYESTGAHNQDIPDEATMGGDVVSLAQVLENTTIVIAMTEFSASAPLVGYTKKHEKLRVVSMPGVTVEMQDTGLSADYAEVAKVCSKLSPLFNEAIGIEVAFSTGHSCYFDLSNNNKVLEDNGMLHPDGKGDRIRNLPSGEVCVVPNENPGSLTAGEIPANLKGEEVVFVVEENKIVDVLGDGLQAAGLRAQFAIDRAMSNIGEVAIGCNDRAKVTGNILEDEKAGFHFAYGRSDHLGGITGVESFSSPEHVVHQDIVYAKGNPIVCKRFDFVFADDERKTVIIDGELKI